VSVADVVAARGISEVVHFTTNHGCLGALYTGNVLSRARLKDDEMVRYLFEPNAELRRDRDYLDFISLSIEHINEPFFNISANKWHRDDPIFWCVLGFDPVVLTHDGVVFATTNNIYSSVRRGVGEAALLRLFADRVPQYNALTAARTEGMRQSYPTCTQAEALYPGSLLTEHLQRIYVRTGAEQSETVGFLKATFHRDVDVVVAPEKFGKRPS
jgi:hypothetical protein